MADKAHAEIVAEPWRTILFILGLVFVGLGIAGIILPVVPGLPFFVVAAICFSRSSRTFHHGLRHSKWFGRGIKDWEDRGVIRLGPKLGLTFFVLMTLGYTFYFGAPLWMSITFAILGTLGLFFVWRSPSR